MLTLGTANADLARGGPAQPPAGLCWKQKPVLRTWPLRHVRLGPGGARGGFGLLFYECALFRAGAAPRAGAIRSRAAVKSFVHRPVYFLSDSVYEIYRACEDDFAAHG